MRVREKQNTQCVLYNESLKKKKAGYLLYIEGRAWRVLRLWIEERPAIRWVAANKWNKQSRTADEGWSSSFGVG